VTVEGGGLRVAELEPMQVHRLVPGEAQVADDLADPVTGIGIQDRAAHVVA